MKGVDEIEFFVTSQSVEDPRRLLHGDAIPSDMGDGKIHRKPFHRAPQESQTLDTGGLLTGFVQGL